MKSRYRRPEGQRRYKKMFIIVAEGTVTEQEYFRLFENESLVEGSLVRVKCLPNKANLPPKEALRRVREYVRKESLKKTDEAWVVVDKDFWSEEHLVELHGWSQSRKNFGFALSNPKFEYWLLLHFEDAKGVATGEDCDKKLAKHLPDYDKHVDGRKFTPDNIQTATDRAKKRDIPPCTDWPRNTGTTVYKLVEKILESGTKHPFSRQ
jgi:hypothetical protein